MAFWVFGGGLVLARRAHEVGFATLAGVAAGFACYYAAGTGSTASARDRTYRGICHNDGEPRRAGDRVGGLPPERPGSAAAAAAAVPAAGGAPVHRLRWPAAPARARPKPRRRATRQLGRLPGVALSRRRYDARARPVDPFDPVRRKGPPRPLLRISDVLSETDFAEIDQSRRASSASSIASSRLRYVTLVALVSLTALPLVWLLAHAAP